MREKLWLFTICSLFLLISSGNAQLDREYEPVIVLGEEIPEMLHQQIDHLYLYAYDATGDIWNMSLYLRLWPGRF